MQYTQITLEQFLRLLGEPQSNGLFSEADLDYILTNADSLNKAASDGWLMKADRLISSMPLAAIGLGSESYKFQSVSEILDYCRERSRHFAKLAGKTAGRVFTTVTFSLRIGTTFDVSQE